MSLPVKRIKFWSYHIFDEMKSMEIDPLEINALNEIITQYPHLDVDIFYHPGHKFCDITKIIEFGPKKITNLTWTFYEYDIETFEEDWISFCNVIENKNTKVLLYLNVQFENSHQNIQLKKKLFKALSETNLKNILLDNIQLKSEDFEYFFEQESKTKYLECLQNCNSLSFTLTNNNQLGIMKEYIKNVKTIMLEVHVCGLTQNFIDCIVKLNKLKVNIEIKILTTSHIHN